MGRTRTGLVALPSAVIVAAAGLILCAPARADDLKLFSAPSFVDTRFMMRQAGQDLPPLMLLPALTATEPLTAAVTPWPSEMMAPLAAVAAGSQGSLMGGYQSAGASSTMAGQAHLSSDTASLWAASRRDLLRPYLDGDGERINTGEERINSQVAGSYSWGNGARLRVFAMRDAFSEARIPYYGIDVPGLERYITSTIWEQPLASGPFDRIEANVVTDEVIYKPAITPCAHPAAWNCNTMPISPRCAAESAASSPPAP